jgi:hypothetical protein
MNYLHNYIGLLGCLLFLVALPLTVFKQPRFSRKTITIVIFSMLGLAILPINDLILLAYIRAVLADLSITSMIMLSILIASSYSGQQYIKSHEQHLLGNSLLVGALILYPLGLGLTPYDTYASGYGSPMFFTGLLIFVAYLFWKKVFFVLGLLLTAIMAYLFNALPSDNLWDYLLDPWIIIVIISRRGYSLARTRTPAINR